MYDPCTLKHLTSLFAITHRFPSLIDVLCGLNLICRLICIIMSLSLLNVLYVDSLCLNLVTFMVLKIWSNCDTTFGLSRMKFVAAYLLAVLAGNNDPSVEDLKTILESGNYIELNAHYNFYGS